MSRASLNRFTDLFRALRLVWSAAHGWTVAWLGLLVIQGLLPVAIVKLTQLLVNALAAALGRGVSWTNLQPVLMYGGLMGAVMVLAEMIQIAAEWIRTAQSELVQDHISALIQNKSVSVDLAFYEMPEFFDHLYRARTDASTRPLALLESSGTLLQNTITLIAMAAVLIPYGWWLPPALLLSTLPAFYVVMRANRRYHDWWKGKTVERRRAQYADLVLTDHLFAPEVRLFKMAQRFQTSFQRLRQTLRRERLELLRKQFMARLGAEAIALALSGVTLIWIVRQALLGALTLGDIALFYQAFSRGQALIQSLLTNVGQIYTNSLFLGNLFEFLQLKSTVVEPARPIPMPHQLQRGITFRNVTFRYPGGTAEVLKDFTLTLPAGKIVAIVGANGAGKSTLSKLICRFYDPQHGSVELDGIDLRQLSLAELRNQVTLMAQTPIPYQATALENIQLGRVEKEGSTREISRAAECAGADEVIARLPRGYDTVLGKWFGDGAELSGGEWQRISMARAFFRGGQIIILDEPTSMMDSWSEAAWFDRFRTLATGKTSLIITHRLTIAAQADIIYVMMDGEIVEFGTHGDLLAQNGQYATSWFRQMQSEANAINTPKLSALGNCD